MQVAHVALLAALLAVAALRIALELRLKSHHREAHRRLVPHEREGNLLVAHANNRRLLGFLLRREYAALGDARLSLLCNAMLAVIVGFLVLLVGGLGALLMLGAGRGSGS